MLLRKRGKAPTHSEGFVSLIWRQQGGMGCSGRGRRSEPAPCRLQALRGRGGLPPAPLRPLFRVKGSSVSWGPGRCWWGPHPSRERLRAGFCLPRPRLGPELCPPRAAALGIRVPFRVSFPDCCVADHPKGCGPGSMGGCAPAGPLGPLGSRKVPGGPTHPAVVLRLGHLAAHLSVASSGQLASLASKRAKVELQGP